MRRQLGRSFVAMAHHPSTATIARTLDARDGEDARRRAEALLLPEFPPFARGNLTISVQELCAN